MCECVAEESFTEHFPETATTNEDLKETHEEFALRANLFIHNMARLLGRSLIPRMPKKISRNFSGGPDDANEGQDGQWTCYWRLGPSYLTSGVHPAGIRMGLISVRSGMNLSRCAAAVEPSVRCPVGQQCEESSVRCPSGQQCDYSGVRVGVIFPDSRLRT